jgi:superfamily I DNA/RNA helicase
MRVLQDVRPTPEQLRIVSRNRPGVEIIRGAAGSGKTTTALLRLRSLIGTFLSRRRRLGSENPVRILVLTYNRTLRGYIRALANQQAAEAEGIDLNISTFARWARRVLGNPTMIEASDKRARLRDLGGALAVADEFVEEEVDYVMGRYLPENWDDYITARRDGRGTVPRVERPLREALLNRVIRPYQRQIDDERIWDWNDLAVKLARNKLDFAYDIVIADETQDFSANQIRAIRNQLADEHSLTFVMDTVQRIYARGFTWQETGIAVRPENSTRLERNYRNTAEIAQFAAPLVRGIPMDDDGTIPDFSRSERHGPRPIVLKGRYQDQVRFVIGHIRGHVDLTQESVAFLHPRGWFGFLRNALAAAGLPFVEITRESEWPDGDENIALSTLHSAKGLEFDHVVMIGLNAEVLQHGDDDEDDQLIRLRRLIAMGIGRARRSVVLGYKATDASRLIEFLDPATYDEREL